MTGFSALPIAQEEGNGGDSQSFKGVARIVGPTWANLPTITIGLLGVQIFWSVEMSYASPYLLSLGLSKSSMAGVFVAGPMSGLIMQPLIGILADNSTSRFGRRRPYMLLGTLICMSAMLLLGFTRPVASIFTGWDNDSNDTLTIWFAVLAIYLIDFSINAVQAVDRALLVDTLPPSKQASGNAWAARMLGVGSVVGFFVGNINLPRIIPFLGKTQLQVLSVVVSIILLSGHLTMAVLVKERVLLKTTSADGKTQRKTFIGELREIWSNIRTLPRVIRQICFIQFFAWIAWFPVLFYSTIYVGDLYKRVTPVADTAQDQLALDAEATRLGSRALFFSALLSLFINIALPAFVSEATDARPKLSPREGDHSWWSRVSRIPQVMQIHLATLWAVSHFVFAACMFATFFTHSVWGSTLIITITGFSWAVTQWAPFSLLAEAILTEGAAHSSGAPTSIRLADTRTSRTRTSEDQEREVFLPGNDSEDEEDGGEDARREERRRVLSNTGAQLSRIDLRTDEDDYEIVPGPEDVGNSSREDPTSGPGSASGGTGSLASKAGIILGIHNIFIVIPQFLVTGFSAVIFALFDPQKPSLPGHHSPVTAPHPGPATNVTALTTSNVVKEIVANADDLFDSLAKRVEVADAVHSNSVVYIFRIGGVASLVAFVLCWRLARELRHR